MKMIKRGLGKKMLTLGLIFIGIGFVLQGLTFNFESGLFKLGLIFSLSGIAAIGFDRIKAAKE